MANFDVSRQMERQLRFLEVSCREYDQGNHDEAVRLATALRVLFHDTGSSTSLLSHSGSTAIDLLSTARVEGPGHHAVWAITTLEFIAGSGKAAFEPLLNKSPTPRMIPFADWWERETIYRSGIPHITRRTLTLWAANKDGGAHVDDLLPQEYENLMQAMGMSLTEKEIDDETNQEIGRRIIDIQNCHLSALRQMAYEVLNSPDILRLAGRN